MFAYVEPGNWIPSWIQVTSMVKKQHMSGKKKLCDVLRKETCFVAVTTDAWASKADISFAMHNAHFIDGNWSLQSYVLATRMFDGRHTAKNVKKHLCAVVKEFIPLRNVRIWYMMKQLTWLLQEGSCMKRSIVKVQDMQLTCFKHVFATHLTHHNRFKSYSSEEAD